MRALNPGSRRTIALARERVQVLTGKEIVKYYHGFNCDTVTGDYLYNCKNIVEGYDLKNCEDCSHCATAESLVDSSDCNFSGASTKGELCCDSLTVGGGYRVLFSQACMSQCADLTYCDSCYSCRDCFGCAGLKSKQYCVLNVQYGKEEYEALVLRIVGQMRKVKEYGQFFPHDFTPFCYNETIAQEYFPLAQDEVKKRGWGWKEEERHSNEYLGPVVEIPDDVTQIGDEITSKVLRCEISGKLYKIIPQELKFYRDMNIPLPTKCFVQRQRERFALRNPRHLRQRQCQKCAVAMQTTYAPDRPETVYCERCYLETVY